jgi:hypothetical protein
MYIITLTSVSFLTIENFLVISIPAILFRSIDDLGPHPRGVPRVLYLISIIRKGVTYLLSSASSLAVHGPFLALGSYILCICFTTYRSGRPGICIAENQLIIAG